MANYCRAVIKSPRGTALLLFRLALSYGMILRLQVHCLKEKDALPVQPTIDKTQIKFRTTVFFSVSDTVEIDIILCAQARIAKCSMLTKNLWTVVHRWEVVQQLGKSPYSNFSCLFLYLNALYPCYYSGSVADPFIEFRNRSWTKFSTWVWQLYEGILRKNKSDSQWASPAVFYSKFLLFYFLLLY